MTEEIEDCKSEFCEVTGEIEDTKEKQYNSRFDKDLDLDTKYVKQQISDSQLEEGFIIYARWSKPSLRIKKHFSNCGIEFLDIENYMEDLQGRNIKKVPAIILKDKVINGYFEVRNYLRNK